MVGGLVQGGMVGRRVRRVVVAAVVLALVVVFGPWPVAVWWRDSGVVGQTELGPTCPASGPGHPCPPPGHVGVWLVVTRDGWPGVFAVSRTGEAGRFRIGLPPGDYTLRVVWFGQVRTRLQGSPFPMLRTPVLHVTVHAHAFTRTQVNFDSGIA